MGRTRKAISEQKGHLTTEYRKMRKIEEQIAAGQTINNIKPPKTLVNSEARKIWKWAINLIIDLPLICELDLLSLEGMCNSFALYRIATAEILKQGFCSPAVSIQKKYAEEYRAFARLCGFTIDGRLKFEAIEEYNIENAIIKEFGDI